jgi:lysophospholipase L1-like esterase
MLSSWFAHGGIMLKPLKKLFTQLVFAPIIITQGRYVKKVTPKLPEATGARSGCTGQGAPIRLLIVGDSAAAGVGAEHQQQALSGYLVKSLAECYTVDWQLLAKSGHTTLASHKLIASQPQQKFDVIVTSLGVNDVTGTLPPAKWLVQQQALIELLRQQFSCQQILITQVPPMDQFPALPQPLRGYLGGRAKQFNRHLARWIDTQEDCQLININGELTGQHMATDGFHPGPVIYQHWAETLAEIIKSEYCKTNL